VKITDVMTYSYARPQDNGVNKYNFSQFIQHVSAVKAIANRKVHASGQPSTTPTAETPKKSLERVLGMLEPGRTERMFQQLASRHHFGGQAR
jgi:hypothetical protein